MQAETVFVCRKTNTINHKWVIEEIARGTSQTEGCSGWGDLRFHDTREREMHRNDIRSHVGEKTSISPFQEMRCGGFQNDSTSIFRTHIFQTSSLHAEHNKKQNPKIISFDSGSSNENDRKQFN
jgi:hypothetical protein